MLMLGPPGPTDGGTSYIRYNWGRTVCPDTEGTELVYSGVAAGSDHKIQEEGLSTSVY